MTESITDQKTTINSICEGLAGLLDYPGAGWPLLIESCSELLADERREISDAFANFRKGVRTLSLSELQEVYTRTFDLSPVCALDIGYHLFGENYKRGVFLANLRETEAPFDLGQEHQLPDYLPVLLRLVARLEDEDLRASLIAECLIPALEKMLKTLREGENPYRHLIEALRLVLCSDHEVDSRQFPARAFRSRASLPVLIIDPRNNTNPHEIKRTREFTAPEFRDVSCDFADRDLFDLKTNPDLF